MWAEGTSGQAESRFCRTPPGEVDTAAATRPGQPAFSGQDSLEKPLEPARDPLTRPSRSRQVDTNTKNVFGQPRLRASLRDLRSPRKNYKSTIEDDLKKLIIMDNLAPEQEREAGVRGRAGGGRRPAAYGVRTSHGSGTESV